MQQALRHGISTTRDPCKAQEWSHYLSRSADSIIASVSNATADVSFPLDRLSLGTSLFDTYETFGNTSDLEAVRALHHSIALQPRNENGGLWYYTYQNLSYLDGMYSFAPFDLTYGLHLDQSHLVSSINDTFLQLDLLYEHCYDNSSGLLFHGYDAAKARVWANPHTGASHIVWGRAIGWYMIALVETLQLLPLSHQSKQWKRLHSRFVCLSDALVQTVDQESGVWWQVMTEGGRSGNFLESSSSAMFVYTLLKGVRLGYLPHQQDACSPSHNSQPAPYIEVANRAYESIVDRFIIFEANQTLAYNNTVGVCSLNSSGTYKVSCFQSSLRSCRTDCILVLRESANLIQQLTRNECIRAC